MKQIMSVAFVALLAACQTAPVQTPAAAGAPVEAAAVVKPSAGQQWLFGSAEASVIVRQTWETIADYVESKAAEAPTYGVVLTPDSSPVQPGFLACEGRPLAAVFDADETLIWNLGSMAAFERMGIGFDPAIWDEWEKTGAGKAVAIPGALEALARIREAGVTVIVNTNRAAENAAGTEATLEAAGIGEFSHGSTLFLRGDAPDGTGKDGRRMMISENYCVIALVGDQLGDIADPFNAKNLGVLDRKVLTEAPAISGLWGNGWFVLPNPVYGPSIRGDFDDIYPEATHWAPSAASELPAAN
ncbi:5'-nucleotidase, lipoprotein e(P4) family [Hyphomonas oceanitis]|uniref:5'-nucleotidase n=1 Tax=Hyphomonas oceanitis SCH89 TaxID=1280953 RepID=A0A059GAU9_9PROT|nr:HAD family acid phosphatase [Hyphomonas oceanitis]KDA03962.1 5'-nucleotidase [Hyphomonas oceanitis SCH89]